MDVLNRIIQYIVNPLIYLLIAVAVIYFLWGVLKFVRNADNPELRPEGARHILWGVIGIAIMLTVFTFVSVIRNTVGSNQYNATPSLPTR